VLRLIYPENLEGVDVAEVMQVQKWVQIRSLKRKYIKMGFIHQIAMYGVLQNKETEEAHYKRIDVLSDTPFTEESFIRVYSFMEFIKNPAPYSIWVYSDQMKRIKEVIWFE